MSTAQENTSPLATGFDRWNRLARKRLIGSISDSHFSLALHSFRRNDLLEGFRELDSPKVKINEVRLKRIAREIN